jgi:hypothetical protein
MRYNVAWTWLAGCSMTQDEVDMLPVQGSLDWVKETCRDVGCRAELWGPIDVWVGSDGADFSYPPRHWKRRRTSP